MAVITIKDVAKKAKVSAGTASMALNGKGAVNPQTIERVIAAAKELGYGSDKYIELMNSKKTKIIGLIVTDIFNPFFGIIIALIQEELSPKGYNIMLGVTMGSIPKEEYFINKFIEMQADGVIIVPSHIQSPDISHLHNLRERKIPFCFLTAYYANILAPCIMTDYSEGSYLLTNYLLNSGHKKIIYVVADRTIPASNLRVEGYLSAYREQGAHFSPDWIVISEATFEGGYASTNEILKNGRPDAILTMNDIMAMGVIKHLKESNIRVPEDISVAGYDDLIYSSLLETPLTTVAQPMQKICKKAVEIILNKIKYPDDTNEKILLHPKLIIRGSTIVRG
jgi:DNA-binding LacI/PurR family transcriptional regulator